MTNKIRRKDRNKIRNERKEQRRAKTQSGKYEQLLYTIQYTFILGS
jgi:hypothetical protein